MIHHEARLQEACVHWFRLQYPKKIIFAIPNGGSRKPHEAFRLKMQGVTRGVPDLFISEHSCSFGGLFIELKAGKKSKLTLEQAKMLQDLAERNYAARVCRSFEEFEETVKNYFNGRLENVTRETSSL